MRIGRHYPIMGELSFVALAVVVPLALAGCSSSNGQNGFTTASLAPRPEEGMRRDQPYSQQAYSTSPPQAARPGPSPSYGQQPQPYSRPYGYGTQTAGYGSQPPRAQAQPYPQGVAPQQQPYPQASSLTTASVAAQPPYGQPPYGQPGYGQPGYGQAPYGQAPYNAPMNQQVPPAHPPSTYAPLTTGSLPRETSTPLSNQGVYLVRDGDTLFGISKRTGVSVKDIAAANKIQDNKISIGQKIHIPQKHAAR